MESQVGAEGMSQPSPDGVGTVGDYVKEQVLQTVITINLAAQVAKDKGITLTEEEITKAKTDVKTYFEQLDPEVVKTSGFTLATLEKIAVNYLYLDKLIDVATPDEELDQELVKNDLAIAAMQDPIYGSIVKYGIDADVVVVKHILIKTIDDATGAPLDEAGLAAAKAKAEEVLAKAKANEDFGNLVVEYSQDEASIPDKGEYTFTKGLMAPEFEEAAFSMKTGEISGLVETTYGYHIIKVEKAATAPTAEQIQERKDKEDAAIKNANRSQKEAAFEEKIELWKTEYNVVVNEKNWAAFIVTGETKPEDKAKETTPEETPVVTPDAAPETPEETPETTE
ncbi:MAG: hypothetical protein CVU84_06415 [Firmicutes bacterium HGW-Firmicutes-1]|nr:MAG: hypothetical protein CVU84_06415 [Firmicutes bacterium HGW-Firmicutes-1]